MSAKTKIAKLSGKTIQAAYTFQDEEGEVVTELYFTDGSTFAISTRPVLPVQELLIMEGENLKHIYEKTVKGKRDW